MKSTMPPESASFSVSEYGVTLQLSIGALVALVGAVEEKGRGGETPSTPTTQPTENPDRGMRLDSLLLSIKEGASILGISRPTIYNLLKGNAIRAVKLGGRTLINTQSLRDYAASLPTFTSSAGEHP